MSALLRRAGEPDAVEAGAAGAAVDGVDGIDGVAAFAQAARTAARSRSVRIRRLPREGEHGLERCNRHGPVAHGVNSGATAPPKVRVVCVVARIEDRTRMRSRRASFFAG
jgi:hypothetical protein